MIDPIGFAIGAAKGIERGEHIPSPSQDTP